jgi:DNA-binding NtrC family response regulator
MKLLLVDDQPSDRAILKRVLRDLPDVDVIEAGSLADARRALQTSRFDAAIVDLRLDDDLRNRDGHVLIRELRGTSTLAIVWSAMREIEEIREAMRNGAYDYLFKDAPHKELVARVIDGLRARRSLESEVLLHRARASQEQPRIHGLVGDSLVIQQLREDIRTVAVGSDKPVLIVGESGVGKELVARGLHALGPHPEAPFIAKNCAAIPESLFESEIFGHEGGAFTGAKPRPGAFAATGRGTLFLDEIGEMPVGQQAKLLRAIESRRTVPVGSDVERPFLGRIVAATLVDLEDRVKKGTFRRDLFMRLSFFPIRVSPLRERTEDIPTIVAHYIKTNNLSPLQLTPEAIANLRAREWEGNVRELQQVVERLAIRPPPGTVVQSEHIDAALASSPPEDVGLFRSIARAILDRLGQRNMAVADEDRRERTDFVDEMTAALFAEALARSDQKKARAARLLGTHRRVIERFLRRDSTPAGSAVSLTGEDDPDSGDDG